MVGDVQREESDAGRERGVEAGGAHLTQRFRQGLSLVESGESRRLEGMDEVNGIRETDDHDESRNRGVQDGDLEPDGGHQTRIEKRRHQHGDKWQKSAHEAAKHPREKDGEDHGLEENAFSHAPFHQLTDTGLDAGAAGEANRHAVGHEAGQGLFQILEEAVNVVLVLRATA